MTDKKQELNEYLAEEILGLEKKEVPYVFQGNLKPHQFVEAWCDEGGSRYEVPIFDPLKNLEQAFDVLEEYDRYFHMINTTSDAVHDSSAEIKSDNGFVTHESNDSCELIVGCILKAEYKFEEFVDLFNET